MSALSHLKPRDGIDDLKVYEPGRPLEEVARQYGLDPAGLVKLASNENSLGPSPRAVEAMRAAATRMHLYPDGGAFYLRQALAERLGVEPEALIFGNGSNELIEFLGHVFLGPGVNLVMSEQAFMIYKLVGAAFGAEVREAPMRGFIHDLDAMLERVDDDTRLVFVANPNNPTGTRVDNDALKNFLAGLPPHVLPVLDEAYVELMDPDEAPDSIAWVREGRPLILLRTFSKAYGLAGLRLGYGIADPKLIRLLEKFRQPFNVNAMAQAAGRAALSDEDYLRRTRELLREGLAYWRRICADLNLETVPSSANFLLIKTGEGRRRFQALQALGVIVRPMDGYGLPDWIRVTVGTESENRRAADALKEVL